MEDQRKKGAITRPIPKTIEINSEEPEVHHSISEEEFDEQLILNHARHLLKLENYEQLSRFLGRLRRRFPVEIEPVIAQVQEQFFEQEGSTLFIP